jgi:hypothetical protein
MGRQPTLQIEIKEKEYETYKAKLLSDGKAGADHA